MFLTYVMSTVIIDFCYNKILVVVILHCKTRLAIHVIKISIHSTVMIFQDS